MIEEAMNLAIEKKGMFCGTVPTASVLKDVTLSLSMGRQEDVPPCEVVSSSVTESGLSFNEQLSDDDFNDQEGSTGPENQQMGFMAKQQENFGEYNDLSEPVIHYCTRFPCDQGIGLSSFIPPNPSSLEYKKFLKSIFHDCTRFPCDQRTGLSSFIPSNPSSLEYNDLSDSIAQL